MSSRAKRVTAIRPAEVGWQISCKYSNQRFCPVGLCIAKPKRRSCNRFAEARITTQDISHETWPNSAISPTRRVAPSSNHHPSNSPTPKHPLQTPNPPQRETRINRATVDKSNKIYCKKKETTLLFTKSKTRSQFTLGLYRTNGDKPEFSITITNGCYVHGKILLNCFHCSYGIQQAHENLSADLRQLMIDECAGPIAVGMKLFQSFQLLKFS